MFASFILLYVVYSHYISSRFLSGDEPGYNIPEVHEADELKNLFYEIKRDSTSLSQKLKNLTLRGNSGDEILGQLSKRLVSDSYVAFYEYKD